MTHTNNTLRSEYWKTKDLIEMTQAEWEALCDGCGKCCLIKLEDAKTDAVQYTNIACRLFDDATCRCGNYALRKQMVKGCVVLTSENIARNAHWMPKTCAYRLIHQGHDLPDWHPLVSNDPESVHKAGISMQGKTIAEYDVEEEAWEAYVVGDVQ